MAEALELFGIATHVAGGPREAVTEELGSAFGVAEAGQVDREEVGCPGKPWPDPLKGQQALRPGTGQYEAGLVGLSLSAKRICTPCTALKPIRISLPPIAPPLTMPPHSGQRPGSRSVTPPTRHKQAVPSSGSGLAREFKVALAGNEVELVALDVEER